MSKSSISTFELFQRFPDAESARLYFEAARWPDGKIGPRPFATVFYQPAWEDAA